MDRVLGLSMTSEEVRWVLVDGVTGDGATLDQGALRLPETAPIDPEALLNTLPDSEDLFAVGLSWSAGAETAATQVCAALGTVAEGTAITGVEATEVLARGIAEVAGYDFLVVCTVEPTETVVATVNGQRVAALRVDGGDAPLIEQVVAAVNGVHPRPDAIFVLGSGDTEELASVLREVTTQPVVTASEAQFALARGAALTAGGACAPVVPEAPEATGPAMRTWVVSAVLAAAVVTFVVSLSLAIVPHRVSESPPPPQHSVAAGPVARPLPKSGPPPVPAAPAPHRPGAAPAELQTLYGPPGAAPEPRLRDRIIEKIPLLNRFH